MDIQKAIEYFDGYGSPYDDHIIELLQAKSEKIANLKSSDKAMTSQKATDLLKHHIETWKGKFPPAHFQACNIAIKALKKQVSKPTERQSNGPYYGKCPTCGRIYWEKGHIDNYCGSCGQRLEG